MKAKKIHETISFKRGQNPHQILGVGTDHIFEETSGSYYRELHQSARSSRELQYTDCSVGVFHFLRYIPDC